MYIYSPEETHNVKNCKEETKMAYFGNNLANGFGLLVDGKQSCIKMCIKRAGCHYWSYSNRSCWLKSSDRGRSYARNFVSGKICGKEGEYFIILPKGFITIF